MIGAILGLIPGLSGLVEGVSKAYFDQKVRIYQAKTGTSRDVAVAAIQASEGIAVRWWFVAAIIPLWALPYIVYDWKVVLVDKLGLFCSTGQCTTDPLTSTENWVHITIVSSLFVHGIMQTFQGSTKQ